MTRLGWALCVLNAQVKATVSVTRPRLTSRSSRRSRGALLPPPEPLAHVADGSASARSNEATSASSAARDAADTSGAGDTVNATRSSAGTRCAADQACASGCDAVARSTSEWRRQRRTRAPGRRSRRESPRERDTGWKGISGARRGRGAHADRSEEDDRKRKRGARGFGARSQTLWSTRRWFSHTASSASSTTSTAGRGEARGRSS